MLALVVTCCLWAAPFQEEFRKRLDEIRPTDAAALVELGTWCEAQGEPEWAYRSYGRVVKLPQGPAYAEATVRMATIEIARKEYQAAYRRLRALDGVYENPEARRILKNAETEATLGQRRAFDRAEAYFEGRSFQKAREAYVTAYRALPSGERPADFIPAGPILRRIANCVDALDDQFFRDEAQPFERSIRPCTACRRDGGFCKCKKCGGKGFVIVTIRIGRFTQTQKKKCGHCNGLRWRLCDKCRGLCHATDFKRLTAGEWKALDDIIDKYRNVRTLKLSLDRAIREMERVVLGVDRAAALSFLRSIAPKYARTKALREVIVSIPPAAERITRANALWKRHNNVLDRADFLSAYAVEFAQYIRAYDGLRGTKRRPNFRAPPLASQPAGELIAPEVLSAFPEEGTTGWLFVKGTLEKYEEAEGDPSKGILTLQGAVPHDIRFFVWLPAARFHLERLEKGPWRSRVSGLATSYPFEEARRKLTDAPRGYLVTVAGRFLRDRLGFPRNWFEVWDAAIGMTPDQERLFTILSEPVEISYEALELGNLVQILRFFGVEPTLERLDRKTRVRCVAAGCPVGLLVDGVAGHLGTTWSCEGEKVVLGSGGADRKDLDVVLTFLKQRRSDFTLDVGSAGEGTSARLEEKPPVPADLASLEERARESIRAMDYRTAAECYQAACRKTQDPAEGKAWERREAAARLFHALTDSTPVSHLAGAEEVHRLSIRTASERTVSLAVSIREKGTAYYVIQPSYGGTIRLSLEKNRIVKQTAYTRDQWRARKAAHLRKLAAGLTGASPLQKVNTLFLIALFCKTNSFPEKGTGYLLKAMKEERFPWLLATYFSREEPTLRGWWKTAASRDEVAAAPPEVEPDESSAPPPKPVDPMQPLPGSPEELRRIARDFYRAGRDSMSRCLPGMEKAATWRRTALGQFKRAQEALGKLRTVEGTLDEDMTALFTEVVVMIDQCIKTFGFFDR